MNTETILRLLQNAGFYNLGTDGTYIYFEDPGCILRSFSVFIEYAWIFISFITVLLLIGWAWGLLSGIGAKTSTLVHNFGSLTLMFGVLGLTIPIVNTIWGDDLFEHGCKTLRVPISDVDSLLMARYAQLPSETDRLYEDLQIYDTGATNSVAPQTTYQIESTFISTSTTTSDTTPSTQRAFASGNDVVYIAPDNTRYRRVNGSRSWRNNNPGNLRYTDFSQRVGAIGTAGGFAIFPDEETGRNAIAKLLRTSTYSQLTIDGAIRRYAPVTENRTEKYIQDLSKLTGLDINRRINNLSNEEIARMVAAIQKIEGYKQGTIIKEQNNAE